MPSLSGHLTVFLGSVLVLLTLTGTAAWQANKTNFLFIMYDDLRPEMSIYGNQDMITPNFERLAKKSVVFDYAFCQIAVCNPSRDSLLTGLRPDTVGTYGFQWSFRPNMAFPALFAKAGYRTAAYGKILHWDGDDKNIWNHDQWDGGWYDYQGAEIPLMNASNMADKIKPVEEFRDYMFTSRAIDTMRKLHARQQLFMVGLGFKLPHLQVHVPFKYFDMYRDKQHMWNRRKKELKFPNSAPVVSHKCCGHDVFRFMREDGGKKAVKSAPIGKVGQPFTQQMHTELSWGYAAAVTFLDAQIGRLLDMIDELELWQNITIVLTSDHGMHNGEKGMWQKWTTFDESTRVPLLISHPNSPFHGQRYSDPVELIDVFPTVLDMFPVSPADSVSGKSCQRLAPDMNVCLPPQGKSLAPVILGTPVSDPSAPSARYPQGGAPASKKEMKKRTKGHNKKKGGGLVIAPSPPQRINNQMPSLGKDLFAVTQSWRCAFKKDLRRIEEGGKRPGGKEERDFMSPWFECDRDDAKSAQKRDGQVCVMGYSLRYAVARYTIWLHWDRVKNVPQLTLPPFAEELYDHRGETLQNFTHLELTNLVHRPEFAEVARRFKAKALHFLEHDVKFRGPYNG